MLQMLRESCKILWLVETMLSIPSHCSVCTGSFLNFLNVFISGANKKGVGFKDCLKFAICTLTETVEP